MCVQGAPSSNEAGAFRGPFRDQGGGGLDGLREILRRKHVLALTIPFCQQKLTCSSFPWASVSSRGCNWMCFPSMQWNILSKESVLRMLMKFMGDRLGGRGWEERRFTGIPGQSLVTDGHFFRWHFYVLAIECSAAPKIWQAPSLSKFLSCLCIQYIFMS